MTVYEEGYSNGIFSSLGWNGAGFTLNVLEDFPTYNKASDFVSPEVFSVDVNGITLRAGWQYDGFEKNVDGDTVRMTVKFFHEKEDVVAYLNTELDGTSVITRWVQFENISEAEMSLGNVVVMGGALAKTANVKDYMGDLTENKLYSVGYFENTMHLHEGLFRWHDVENVRKTVY